MASEPTTTTRIEAAIDRAEQVARAAMPAGVINERWYVSRIDENESRVRERSTQAPVADVIGGVFADRSQQYAEHIALNDPAAVLRRCAADRRVLERHQQIAYYGDSSQGWACSYEWGDGDGYRIDWTLCPEIRSLADRWGIEIGDPS